MQGFYISDLPTFQSCGEARIKIVEMTKKKGTAKDLIVLHITIIVTTSDNNEKERTPFPIILITTNNHFHHSTRGRPDKPRDLQATIKQTQQHHVKAPL